MNKIKRVSLIVLSIIMCFWTIEFVSIGRGLNVYGLTVAAADAASSVIRVKLSVGEPIEIAFTTSGTYSIGTQPLPSGQYRIKLENGSISMINEDGATLLTSSTTLMIQENLNPDPAAVNLISMRVADVTRKYLGSMKFWIDGTHIDAVNHVYLEKYLYGVVPYEMSDYFPLEALKAQAVAARCYAIKDLEGTRSGTYDIGDTSSDQVYKGYDPSLTNSKKAVDATAGKVLTYSGTIIDAYYSASNGGQTDRTENVWSTALPFFKIREDTYDLANPYSLQKVVYFPIGSEQDKVEGDPSSETISYSEDIMDPKLVDFLKTFAVKALVAKNATLPVGSKYAVLQDTITVKAITGMTAIQTDANPHCDHHPDSTDDEPHDADNCPSIDFTGLKMTVLLKVAQEDAAAEGGYRLVDYSWNFQFVISTYLKSVTYPQWEVFSTTSSLRIYAVERGKDANGAEAFKLINRRYGHGIGLSQRGAQQRAKDQNPDINQFQNILAFYYPKTVLADSGLVEPQLPPLPELIPAEITAPKEVTGLSAISSSYNSIKLNWTAVTDATRYIIYRATAPEGPYNYIAVLPGTSYVNSGLVTGTTYYYKIRAYTLFDTIKVYSEFSTVVSAKPIPTVPTGLTAISSSYNSIKLNWTAVTGATRYIIYRATAPEGPYNYIAVLPGTSYVYSGLVTGTTYYYKIRAYTLIDTIKVYSGVSTVVSAKPIPTVPTGLTAISSSYNSIKLNWTAVTGATRYIIYRATALEGPYYYIAVLPGTSYVNSGLVTGTTYYYKIRAYTLIDTIKVYSGISTVVSVKPLS